MICDDFGFIAGVFSYGTPESTYGVCVASIVCEGLPRFLYFEPRNHFKSWRDQPKPYIDMISSILSSIARSSAFEFENVWHTSRISNRSTSDFWHGG